VDTNTDPDPHQIERLDPHPHESDKLDPDPDPNQSAQLMSLYDHFFKVLSLYVETRIRIRNRITFTGKLPFYRDGW
jgi:hypothetical protein